jgi:hypothetical protein
LLLPVANSTAFTAKKRWPFTGVVPLLSSVYDRPP